MAYQSLYRRYRSRTFAEVLGQPHVTMALRTAVAEGRHGHAYLFSGPRGTGKTSTARVLAKALNCDNLQGGEPCCACTSCKAIEAGRSFDLHELDAASHNKVDDIRELISKVHLGSPGRTKVYILDEVHMLSSGAENALLKTLEEPPEHVVFVLATTEPQKVVPTIRSRAQHFEFHLLPAEVLADHLRHVIADAGLDGIDEAAVDYVLRQGGGSARDTLSALDLVAAAGGVPRGDDVAASVLRAIGAADPGQAIAAIQEGLELGREPRTIGEDTLALLRNAFLATMGASLAHLNDKAQELAEEIGHQLGPATLTRSLETIGTALVDMRQAPDPRVPLEVALLRLTRKDLDTSSEALLQRISQLERQVADLAGAIAAGVAPAASQGTAGPATRPPGGQAPINDQAPADHGHAAPAPAQGSDARPSPDGPPPSPRPPRGPRMGEPAPPAPRSPRRLAAVPSDGSGTTPPAGDPLSDAAQGHAAGPDAPPQRTGSPGQTPAAGRAGSEATGGSSAKAAAPAGDGRAIDQGSAVEALATQLDDLSQRVRVRFKGGRVVGVDGATIRFGVPNTIHRDRCIEVKADVEAALGRHFGQAVTVEVVVDRDHAPPGDPAKVARPARPADDDEDDIGPMEDLIDATDQSSTGVERLTRAFPGSEVIEGSPE